MIIEPKIRGSIGTTAHPIGCAKNVMHQIQYVTNQPPLSNGPQRVLIIGASAGYGLASRIVTAFGAGAQTIGVFLERAAEGKRTASAGWYNTAAFEEAAHPKGLYAKSILGDAFLHETKQKVIQLIEQDWGGQIDLVVYSIAAPRRTDPNTGERFQAVLKPIGEPYMGKTVGIMSGCISEVRIEPATTREIESTIAVMGGQDWLLWIDALQKANLLAEGVQTVAYSYLGPAITYPIYAKGTIGQAKKHLQETCQIIQQQLQPLSGKAFIAVAKAITTQASSAIPVIPLYMSLLYKVMKEKNLHEGCIEQIYRLYAERLYRVDQQIPVDAQGLIRTDDWEMQEDVQQAVATLWATVDDANVDRLTDLVGYRGDFYRIFGFEVEGVDYAQECSVDLSIPSLIGA